jgi:hypothetical protein
MWGWGVVPGFGRVPDMPPVYVQGSPLKDFCSNCVYLSLPIQIMGQTGGHVAADLIRLA